MREIALRTAALATGLVLALAASAPARAADSAQDVARVLEGTCLMARTEVAMAAVRERLVDVLTQAAPSSRDSWEPAITSDPEVEALAQQFALHPGGFAPYTPEALASVARWLDAEPGARIAREVCERIHAAGRQAAAPVMITADRRNLLLRLANSPIWAPAVAREQLAVAASIDFIAQYANLRADENALSLAADEMVRRTQLQAPVEELASWLADNYLAAVLAPVPDDDLRTLVDFFETAEARLVLGVLERAPAARITTWTSMQRSVLSKHVPAVAATDPGAAKTAMKASVSAAEQALEGSGGADLDSLIPMLQNAATILPDDPQVLRALGLAATRGANAGLPPGRRLPQANAHYLEMAAKALERAVELTPKDGKALHYLGYVRFMQERFDDAKAAYDAARKAGYREARAHTDLGDLLFELGDAERSFQSHLQALAFEPPGRGNLTAFYALATAQAIPARMPALRQAFEAYLARTPNAAVERGWYATMLLAVSADYLGARAVLGGGQSPLRTGFERRLLAETYILDAARNQLGGDGFPDAKGRELLDQAIASGQDIGELASALLSRPKTADAVLVLARAGAFGDDQRRQHAIVAECLAAGHEALAVRLLDAGLDPSVPLDGGSALHVAAASSMQAAVRALLSRGADPSVRDWNGKLPVELVPDPTSEPGRAIVALLQARERN